MSESYMLAIATELAEQINLSLSPYFARQISGSEDVQKLIEELAGIGVVATFHAFTTPPAASPAVNAPSQYRPAYVYYLWNAYYNRWSVWNSYVNSWTWTQN